MSGKFFIEKSVRGLLASLLCLLITVDAALAKECDKTKCKGPVRIYEDLNCKPVYEKPGDCCAIRYNCSYLSKRSPDKCYAKGRVYEIGDKLNVEDRSNPCEEDCICIKEDNDIAMFMCPSINCYNVPKEGCYLKEDLKSCCGGKEVCPSTGEKRAECEVDGKTYMEGESFDLKDNPELSCQCMEGYKGENVAPFCRTISCNTDFRRPRELHKNCVPVFMSHESPRTSCSIAYRCQTDKDTFIHVKGTKSKKSISMEAQSEESMCKFGNTKMHIGDELIQATYYSSVCVKCVCEVPPMPTCQELPNNKCDVINHPKFP